MPMDLPLRLDLPFFTQMVMKFKCARLADAVKKLPWPKNAAQLLTICFDPDKSELIRYHFCEIIRRPKLSLRLSEGFGQRLV